MKVFSKERFINFYESRGMLDDLFVQLALKSWVIHCDGQPVCDGLVTGTDSWKYISDEEWEIEVE